jgi:phosphoribosylformylglycinamidine cyclo-ligase
VTPPDEPRQPLTYANVGINLSERQRTVGRYKEVTRAANRPEVLGGIGPFAGLYALGAKYRDPVIVSTTDTVGTKGKVASLLGRYEGLGHDIVNHCVNDAFTTGAEPLFFMDTIVSADLTPDAKVALVKGVADACAELGVALLGGETADMPGVYVPGGFDLIGFVVGVVERDQIIDGTRIAAGDLLFALPSNGLHTNGYSLARPALGIGIDSANAASDQARLQRVEPELGESLADALLRPHRCYHADLKPALALIKGMAHITGGGLEENLPRMLPDGPSTGSGQALGAALDLSQVPVPPILPFIQSAGGIETEEMYRVFNMGVGIVVAVAPGDAQHLRSVVPEAIAVGEVVPYGGSGPRVTWR